MIWIIVIAVMLVAPVVVRAEYVVPLVKKETVEASELQTLKNRLLKLEKKQVTEEKELGKMKSSITSNHSSVLEKIAATDRSVEAVTSAHENLSSKVSTLSNGLEKQVEALKRETKRTDSLEANMTTMSKTVSLIVSTLWAFLALIILAGAVFGVIKCLPKIRASRHRQFANLNEDRAT